MKIVITARNYSEFDPRPMEVLKQTGAEIVDYSGLNLGVGISDEQMQQLVGDADIAIVGVEPYSRATIEACPNLKLISRSGIGYNNVDVDACRERGVTLCRTVGAVEGCVAEHVMAYILHFARSIAWQNECMHQGQWVRKPTPGTKGKTLGLVGFGGIGKEIALRARPFGMELLYFCRHPNAAWEREYGVVYAPLEELLGRSDYVSLNVPMTEDTAGMFDYGKFRKMKEGGIFINIARGGVMVEKDLKRALEEGHLAGAGIDVYNKEPCTDSLLMSCPTAVLTPHTGGFTGETVLGMQTAAAQNVADFLQGRLKERNKVV